MLAGLLDVILKPLEDHIAAIATKHAEGVGEQLIRSIAGREVQDVVIPRAAAAGALVIAGAAINFYAFATRNRDARAFRTSREVLRGFQNPLAPTPRRRRRRR